MSLPPPPQPLGGGPMMDGSQFTDVASFDDGLTFGTLPDQGQPDHAMAYDFQTWADFSTSGPWDGSPSDWPWQILNDDMGSGMHNAYPQQHTMNPKYVGGSGQSSTALTQSNDNMTGAAAVANPDQPGSSGSSDDENENEAEIIPRLAARFGTLRVSADGRLRYYGSASNHHFLGGNSVDRDRNMTNVHDLQRETLIALENAQLDRPVPPSLEEHLIDVFFEWYNPCHMIVDRPTFELGRARGVDGQDAFCSQSLIAAM